MAEDDGVGRSAARRRNRKEGYKISLALIRTSKLRKGQAVNGGPLKDCFKDGLFALAVRVTSSTIGKREVFGGVHLAAAIKRVPYSIALIMA